MLVESADVDVKLVHLSTKTDRQFGFSIDPCSPGTVQLREVSLPALVGSLALKQETVSVLVT